MSTQRPHHHQIKRMPPACILWLTRTSSAGCTPPIYRNAIMRNKPIKTTHAKGVPPLYLTPTEVGETPTTPKMQNEPNFSPPHAQKCETNPICPTPTIPPTQKMRNEPNSRIPGVPPPPISAKRTQLPHTNIHSTIYNPCARRKDQKAIDMRTTSSYHARFAGRIRELFL